MGLSRLRAVLAGVAALTAVLTGMDYLRWRVTTLQGTDWLGVSFFGAEALNFLSLAVAVLLLLRVRYRPGPPAPPSGSLDVFITVCGEPVEMVERSLRAALAIRHPHATYLLNDGRMAGKAGWEAMEQLAERYGVRCLTRTTGVRGKAGNVNHALQHSSGDYVLVIDADHQAGADAADQTLGYFDDPDVAFVCTPQLFRPRRREVLNNRELLFYRAIQPAKDADGCAFSCGNATVYRRAALDEIGGFSEWNLVEDLHTSYELHARGWRSVYHPRPLTLGDAPETAAAYAKQRLTWATDSLRLLLWDSPLWKRGLSWRQRVHYLHTCSFYLIGATHLLFIVSPALYIIWGVPVMQFESTADYLRYSVPYLASLLLTLVLYGGLTGARQLVQSMAFLSPVFVIAAVRAATGVRYFSGVTEKARQSRVSYLVVPHLALAALLVAALVTALSSGEDRLMIAAFWAGWSTLLLAAPLSTLGGLWFGRSFSAGLRGVAVLSIGLVGLGPALLSLQPALASIPAPHLLLLPDVGEGAAVQGLPGDGRPTAAFHRASRPRTPRRLAGPDSGIYLGVFNETLRDDAQALRRWSRQHGLPVAIVHWYQQWGSPTLSEFQPGWLAMTARQGAVPMITWEPWRKPAGSVTGPDQPAYRLRRIIDGEFDDYIRAWARQAARHRDPILLRPLHEMNGWWYPWSVSENGNTPRDFVAAWRHIHDIFRQERADNVSWVWSVNAIDGLDQDVTDLQRFYPGDEYVDWVSTTGFNWGTTASWSRWRDFDTVFAATYEALESFGKPIIFCEVGTVADGGDPAAWISDAVARIADDYPLLQAVVWFDADYPGAPDFSLTATTGRALRDAVQAEGLRLARPTMERP
jgi:cellulose synthase (UDP-forming)